MSAHIEFMKLRPEAVVPENAYNGDAGLDLIAVEDVIINIGERGDVRTGLAMAMPTGFYGRLVGRSSAIRKKGLLIVEGIIDQGFRGELLCHAWAVGPASVVPFKSGVVRIQAGESVAQLIVSPIPNVYVHEVDELPASERGDRGFGSSGR